MADTEGAYAMSRKICLNLSAAEARAWADGATCLIRPLATGVLRIDPDGTIVTAQQRRDKWQAGDVLIGREVWCVPGQRILARPRSAYRVDLPEADAALFHWRSAVTMPKALARHRYPVVSVRVCKFDEVTDIELSAAHICVPDCGPLDYVSVTMLERT